ncbi:MAG: single-stranded-DNA-specific exonuclease RecJ [Oscillatoriales cyanobacterium RM2_1_1]|nr:single-stranded-DNA-specific exonuclease RecJ [Oscillatoriales cyanobacterium RM2_1_1]
MPDQRWSIFPANPQQVQGLAQATGLSPLLAQVLVNRGIHTLEQARMFLDPESQTLPSPLEAFPDLETSVNLLHQAMLQGEKIAICGDYDADGMTSTALLMRSLSWLGAQVSYAIPSRMTEGYGINCRIVEEFYHQGIRVILTVDNGISAYEPIVRARELELVVIVTDHHDLPPELPPAQAILNPKLIDPGSPYRGLAGVGVAYVLAVCLAQRFDQLQGLINPLLELFTLGTIADLAPLQGVNRRWVKRGLQRLPNSQIPGIQALIQVAGVSSGSQPHGNSPNQFANQAIAQKTLKPDDIGFRLGPRINAVGRIADPQIVIELLTTDDPGIALERALQCEQVNQQRRQLCETIEQEAIAWCERSQIDLKQTRVLVIVQPDWHHGVIGIVASRLVERYGVPVFIGTYEESAESEAPCSIRGSARSIPEFHVFEALQFCEDLLSKFGGHRAAGGFSMPGENLEKFCSRLQEFAHQWLEIQHLKPLVMIDVQANLADINWDLYQQISHLQPCGIENKSPIFWTPDVKVIRQRLIGKGHIKLTLSPQSQVDQPLAVRPTLEAIGWRWGDYFPLPETIDIAYQLRENTWNQITTVELELLGIRLPQGTISPTPTAPSTVALTEFYYGDRKYCCTLAEFNFKSELRIQNLQGEVLAIPLGQQTGLLGKCRAQAKSVDLSQPFFSALVEAACRALAIKNW